jgi:hypothetical protein
MQRFRSLTKETPRKIKVAIWRRKPRKPGYEHEFRSLAQLAEFIDVAS